jgi:hypothetical protein
MNEDYKLKDIIEEFKKLNTPSRKRELVDQRSYLIGLMYFKFDLTEEQIASKINIKRAKVQYNKHLPAKYSGQPDYAYNIDTLALKYPFEFPAYKVRKKKRNGDFVKVKFSKYQRDGLVEARKELGHTDVAITVRYLVNKALKNKIWDI